MKQYPQTKWAFEIGEVGAEKGYICPAGYYCDGGSDIDPAVMPVLCPAGTYNDQACFISN